MKRKKTPFLKIILLAFLFPGSVFYSSVDAQSKIFNVRDFGASGIKSQKATTFIQAAIDSAFHAGGGTVLLPPGEYLSGTLFLRSNINFKVDSGATLFASRDSNDFSIPEGSKFQAFIYAGRSQNITMSGKGRIDGQAERVWEPLKAVDKFITDITENAKKAGVEMSMYYKVRPIPFLVFMYNCSNLLFEDITLWEANFWTLHLFNCENIEMRNLFVYSSLESGVNADGIDLNACRNVKVHDCKVVTGDDAICLKSWPGFNWPCSNIEVWNCELSSSSTALKIGTETFGDVENINFHDCEITNTNRGLSIVARDGGKISNVQFSNILIQCNRRHFNWWGNGDPIWIVLNQRHSISKIGSIENISFNGIFASARGTSRIETTFPDSIRDIHLESVFITMLEEDYKDKRANWVMEIKSVKGLEMENLILNFDLQHPEPLWQGALRMENVSGIDANRLMLGTSNKNISPLALHDCQDAEIKELNIISKSKGFYQTTGEKSRMINIAKPKRIRTKSIKGS